MRDPFRYLKTLPDIIRLAVMMYIRFPLSLRQVEDLLHERGIDISHESVRAWWNRFGPMFAAEIRKKPFRRRERTMAKFRSVKSLQKFAAVHASVYNHCNRERHLYSRENFKLNRAAALSEWRQIAA